MSQSLVSLGLDKIDAWVKGTAWWILVPNSISSVPTSYSDAFTLISAGGLRCIPLGGERYWRARNSTGERFTSSALGKKNQKNAFLHIRSSINQSHRSLIKKCFDLRWTTQVHLSACNLLKRKMRLSSLETKRIQFIRYIPSFGRLREDKGVSCGTGFIWQQRTQNWS